MHCRRFFLPIVFLFTFYGHAQRDYAKRMLDSLCSERYDGRGYVNQGDNRAADFIIEQLEEIGVTPFKKKSFVQPYEFDVNTFPKPVSVVLGSDTLIPGADYLIDPNSGSASGHYTLVEVNTGNFEAMYQQEISGPTKNRKQNLYAFNFTNVKDQEKRNQFKALAYQSMAHFPVIWVETNKQMYGVGRRQMAHPLITIDSASYISSKTASLEIENVFVPEYQTKNIIGLIPGKKKRKYIVLCGHYDHLGRMGEAMFPGANDNASGVAMLLSLAKYYIAYPPKYSIALCFFSGEEAGLEGSRYFVQHPFFKLKRVKFVLNIDIMGGAEKGITLVNGTKHTEAFETIVEINQTNEYLDVVKKRGPTANSDHYFFSQSGVPAFFIYSMGNVKNYHDIYDTADNTPLNKFDGVQSLLIDFIATR